MNLFLQYISLHKKNIIIVEDDALSIEFISKMVSEENTFCVHLENNNVFIKECFDVTKEEKFLLRNQSIGNLLKENPSSTIEDILYKKIE